MPLNVLLWTALFLSAVVILEIPIAALLYTRLRRQKKRLPETPLSFLGISLAAAYALPLAISVLLLLAEAIVLFYFIWSFAAAARRLSVAAPRESDAVEEAPVPDAAAAPLHRDRRHGHRHDPNIAAYLRMLAGIRRNQRNRAIVNLETLSAHFESHEPVTIHSLKEKKLIPAKTDHVKILGKGTLDKLLHVEAHDFSDEAMEAIFLTGGRATQIV